MTSYTSSGKQLLKNHFFQRDLCSDHAQKWQEPLNETRMIPTNRLYDLSGEAHHQIVNLLGVAFLSNNIWRTAYLRRRLRKKRFTGATRRAFCAPIVLIRCVMHSFIENWHEMNTNYRQNARRGNYRKGI